MVNNVNNIQQQVQDPLKIVFQRNDISSDNEVLAYTIP